MFCHNCAFKVKERGIHTFFFGFLLGALILLTGLGIIILGA